MKRATAETFTDPKTGEARTRYWVWAQGRRRYMPDEPGPKTDENRRRNWRRRVKP